MKHYIILLVFSTCCTLSSMEHKFIQFEHADTIQTILESHHQFYLLSQQTEISTVLGNGIFTSVNAKKHIMQCLADSNNSFTQTELDNLAKQIMTLLPTKERIFTKQNPINSVIPQSNNLTPLSDREKWSLILAAKL